MAAPEVEMHHAPPEEVGPLTAESKPEMSDAQVAALKPVTAEEAAELLRIVKAAEPGAEADPAEGLRRSKRTPKQRDFYKPSANSKRPRLSEPPKASNENATEKDTTVLQLTQSGENGTGSDGKTPCPTGSSKVSEEIATEQDATVPEVTPSGENGTAGNGKKSKGKGRGRPTGKGKGKTVSKTPSKVKGKNAGVVASANPDGTGEVMAPPKAVFNFSGLVSPHRAVKKQNTTVDNNIDERSAPRGEPEVWAESRQALCEALPYYRAFQSGAYVTRGYCYGLMVDKMAGERDLINEHLVIARAGGGMAKVDGEMSQVADQTADSSVVSAMMHNMKDEIPLVLILGRDNPKAPARISHRYGVLGHFQLTRIWCEKAGAKNTYMYRFEKLNLAEDSWWMPPGPSLLPQAPDESIHMALASCLYCNQTSEQIYTEAWMCLNEHCPAFWTIDRAPPQGPLVYTDAFLNERRGWAPNRQPPFSLRPPLPTPDDRDPASAVSRGAWKGIVCPDCGRCNSRVEWKHWKCETAGCGFVYTVPFEPFSYRSVAGSFDMFFEGLAVPSAKPMPYVKSTHQFAGNYRINHYHLPGCGWVSHIQVNRPIATRPGGPDDMFLRLQQEDLGLKRFPLANSGMPGGLTAHFAVNFGMPYKYIVAVDSKPFSEAPDLILNVLHRLQWAAGQTHAADDGSFTGFNELLAVGYLEEQKMGYHDDGEPGLGPTVASLSLGADATMSWRMKKTPYWGISKGGVLRLDEQPVEGCQHYEERKKLFLKGDEMPASERKALEQKVLDSQSQRNAPVALTLTLRHGDIMVMHGADIQKYYEHGVQPHGKLRYALTCRYIDPAGIPEDQRWKADYDRTRFPPYNGDPGISEV